MLFQKIGPSFVPVDKNTWLFYKVTQIFNVKFNF
jgi:hypothetical protein